MDFLLIHGAYHGAWCWQPLINELNLRGANGYAFDLPGHGRDSTPLSKLDRQSYLAAAERAITELSSEHFVLVGHSLAGILLPDLAKKFSSRVSQVVYLAALVLRPGERAVDLIPESRRPNYYKIAESSEDNTLWMDFNTAKELFFNDIDSASAMQFYKKLNRQPFQVYLDAAFSLTFSCPVRYIVCDSDQTLPPKSCISWAGKLPAEVLHIDAGHDVMLSKPAKLAELLCENCL